MTRNCCEDCRHRKFLRGAQRGIMDCDPDEIWCDMWKDYFYGEREYDEETEEELPCENYDPIPW